MQKYSKLLFLEEARHVAYTIAAAPPFSKSLSEEDIPST